MTVHILIRRGTIVLLLLGLLATTALAVPPHPDVMQQIGDDTSKLPRFLTDRAVQYSKGICTGCNPYAEQIEQETGKPYRAPSAVGQFKVLAILVDFSDNVASTSATYFDSLIFDSLGQTVRDYFNEVSYGQLELVTDDLPSAIGWVRAPQTYDYYVDSGYGTDGTYPNNSQGLFVDLINQVDASVDFSQYDNDGNGTVDVVMIIHAGQGAERTGDPTDIWSHKWGISPVQRDGVWLSDYTIQAEYHVSAGDMTIGVYAHELAHGFGLPDLYDIDNDAYGIGNWGLMGHGAWLGASLNGESPSHPCAWSKIQMGLTTPTIVSANLDSQAIPNSEFNQAIFRLWNAGNVGDEYFLVENRQKTGYDTYLPSSGILIWHIDDAMATSNNRDNANQWYPPLSETTHLRVALEQADGTWDLEKKFDKGDATDAFTSAIGRNTFDASTLPNSDAYGGATSYVAVQNILQSNDTLFADLVVGLSSGVGDDDPVLPQSITLKQNYPNPFNPSTTISYSLATQSHVKLEVFNVLGERVKLLVNEDVPAGEQSIDWNGENDHGEAVASGLYFYRLAASDANETRKMILLK